jgi:hypothetical protein
MPVSQQFPLTVRPTGPGLNGRYQPDPDCVSGTPEVVCQMQIAQFVCFYEPFIPPQKTFLFWQVLCASWHVFDAFIPLLSEAYPQETSGAAPSSVFTNLIQTNEGDLKMKISRILKALVTTFSAGWITAAIIILLSFGQPDRVVATGGCTAPDGECSATSAIVTDI